MGVRTVAASAAEAAVNMKFGLRLAFLLLLLTGTVTVKGKMTIGQSVLLTLFSKAACYARCMVMGGLSFITQDDLSNQNMHVNIYSFKFQSLVLTI